MRNHSPVAPRALLVSLHAAAVQGADPFSRTRDAVDDWIVASHIDRSAPVRIFALGKAGATMAAGAVTALRHHGVVVKAGVVVVAARPGDVPGHPPLPEALEVRVGDHPVPDIGSLAAADVIARTVLAVSPGDVALVLISGGATSLCAAPAAELTRLVGHPAAAQALLMELVSTLHERGLAIHEMNALRRRLLRWGAGRLAVALARQGVGSIPVFAVSDVIGDDPAVIGSGPCSPDRIDDAEFLAMLDAHDLRTAVPGTLAVALGLQGEPADAVAPPAVNDPAFDRVQYRIVARNEDACNAMVRAAQAAGVRNIARFPDPLAGEAETLGRAIVQFALHSARAALDEQLYVWGGEPTVNMTAAEDVVDDAPPLGGRMQTLALAAAIALFDARYEGNDASARRITLVAAGTDGRDGPTDACGAVVDAFTCTAMYEQQLDPAAHLRALRSYHALDAAGALLRTGPTGTNVMDVVAVHIAPATGDA